MNKLYSPSMQGFYYVNAPADAVEVSPEDELMIRDALSIYSTVEYDGNGGWIITPRVFTPAELQASAEIKKSALQAVASEQISILTDATDPDIVDNPTPEDVALLVLWKKYRQALRAVATNIHPVIWPDVPPRASGTNDAPST